MTTESFIDLSPSVVGSNLHKCWSGSGRSRSLLLFSRIYKWFVCCSLKWKLLPLTVTLHYIHKVQVMSSSS